MNPLTLEWEQKAEGDYAAAQWLQQATNLIHDAICFHAQQCIEKYLIRLLVNVVAKTRFILFNKEICQCA